MTDLKLGDKLKIVNNRHRYHTFPVGTPVEVNFVSGGYITVLGTVAGQKITRRVDPSDVEPASYLDDLEQPVAPLTSGDLTFTFQAGTKFTDPKPTINPGDKISFYVGDKEDAETQVSGTVKAADVEHDWIELAGWDNVVFELSKVNRLQVTPAPPVPEVGDEVNTSDELRVLPFKTIITDRLRAHVYLRLEYWQASGGNDQFTPVELAQTNRGPFTVISLPDGDDG